MMRRYTLLAGAVLLSASGCSTKSAETPHNQDYFASHPDERAKQLENCKADQNHENPLNCVAAEDAQRNADLDKDMAH